jgi:UDP-N-acetylmuramoyl-L-alanine---L-glutamate ligase
MDRTTFLQRCVRRSSRAERMRLAELAGQRVAIWGCGREGRAVLSALHTRVPSLRPTVFCAIGELADVAAAASGAEVIASAPGVADLSAFDVVIKSPGISAYRPELLEARRNGTRFTSATALWFAESPHSRVIAVTGTKGKSTTTALIAHLLRARGRYVALAGNIGMPLIELLDPPREPDWWVVELSSFQTREAAQVDVAVITNLEEEHLDWHGDRSRYVDDKLALAGVARVLVVNAGAVDLLARTQAHPHRERFGDRAGFHVGASALMRGEDAVFDRALLPLPGRHNALNACAALAALEAAGEDAAAAAPHLASFRPLPHRLQHLGMRDGLAWIDDSIATTPQASLEALASVDAERTWLLVGGHDRGLDWRAFAEAVSRQPPRAIIANGASARRIAAVLGEVGGAYGLHVVATLADAVALARAGAVEGDTLLLSPGAPSFDQFRDYAERGSAFAAIAGFDASSIGAIGGLGIA